MSKEYWKNRKAGKRGQGKPPKPKFYPKGELVGYKKKVLDEKTGKVKLVDANYPNAEPTNYVRVSQPNGSVTGRMVNRVDNRKMGNYPKPDRTVDRKTYDPTITNHDRILIRKKTREQVNARNSTGG